MDYKTTPSTLTAHTLERKGCPLHYWLGGLQDRPLIAMMHGATMDHRMFNPQVEEFISDYRVLVWDARGHGQSQPIGACFDVRTCAKDMLAILDAVEVEQAILCGQSMGGLIAQNIYRMAPERVRAMIVIGATPIAKGYSKWEVWTTKATLPLFNLWPYNYFQRTVAKSTAAVAEVRSYALDAMGQIAHKDFLTIWKAVTLIVDDEGIPGFVHEIPLLLIHGDQDKAGTIARDMPLWAEWEPQATYAVIPNASHNANQDNPAETNRYMREFLKGYF